MFAMKCDDDPFLHLTFYLCYVKSNMNTFLLSYNNHDTAYTLALY